MLNYSNYLEYFNKDIPSDDFNTSKDESKLIERLEDNDSIKLFRNAHIFQFEDTIGGIAGNISPGCLIPYFKDSYHPLYKEDSFLCRGGGFKSDEFKMVQTAPDKCYIVGPQTLIFDEDEERADEVCHNDIGGYMKQLGFVNEKKEDINPPEFNLLYGPPGSGKKLSDDTIITFNENNDKILIKFISKKQRGKMASNKKKKQHLANDRDNIRAKIQINFQNFIPSFFNDIIYDFLEIKNFFLKFDYSKKKLTKYEYFEKLKKSTIEEIFKISGISKKYKNVSSNYNNQKLVFLDKSKSIKKLLNMNYLDFFLIYYNNNEPLKQFKIDGKIIQLSKETKSFYYLIQKYKKDKKYFNEIIKMDYLDKIELTNESEYNKDLKELNLEENSLEISFV